MDRFGLMTYDFSGGWANTVGFNAATSAPEGSGQVSIEGALEQLIDLHGCTEEDFTKIALGVGFYGRSQGNVYETDPGKLPGSSSSGKGPGGTVEDGLFSYFDLYDNFIGESGKGINGWTVYHYP